jgi:hypothetical protein
MHDMFSFVGSLQKQPIAQVVVRQRSHERGKRFFRRQRVHRNESLSRRHATLYAVILQEALHTLHITCAASVSLKMEDSISGALLRWR